MAKSAAELFTSDPDWAAYAESTGIKLPKSPDSCPIDSIIPATLDIINSRKDQATAQNEWTRQHPLSSVGYKSHEFVLKVRDGAEVAVKVSWPIQRKNINSSLPLLFVTHGGGWIQGTHVSEEQWLLWPLYHEFDLVIVSVEYRLAPEHEFPTWIEDSWDVLQKLLSSPNDFVVRSGVQIDLQRVILAGSSAGATITAVLSQKCRDLTIPIYGVILNVPVLCDYRHLPRDELLNLNDGGSLSYEQCTGALLSSGLMKAVWDLAIPSPTLGSSSQVSPLFGKTTGLAPHLIFVAGQDPLRDEGMRYAQKLKEAQIPVRLTVYPGVPHVFAEIHELESTRMFWRDIKEGLDALFRSASEL